MNSNNLFYTNPNNKESVSNNDVNNQQVIDNNVGTNNQINNNQPSENNIPQSKKKRKKGLIIFIIVLILLIIGLSGFIVYDKFINKPVDNNNNNNNIDCTKCNVNDNSEKNDDNKQEDNIIESNKLINFDETKCINTDLKDGNYEITRWGHSQIQNGLSFTINAKTVEIFVRYDLLFPGAYKQEDINNNTVKYYDNIKLDFEQNVEFIFGGIFSDNGKYNLIIFLMEDGTLEYMKLSEIFENKKFEHEPILGIGDIVRFDNIIIQDKDKPLGGTKYTAIAYKIDGSFYDLSKLVNLNN